MNIRSMCAVAVVAIAASAMAFGAGGLYDEYWDYELHQDPFLATTSGDDRYNDRVPDVSATAQHARLEQLRAFQARLRDETNSGDPLNAELLRFILEHDIALGEFEPWRIPFLSDSGFHMNIGYVVSSTRFEIMDDYRDYLLRLRALPGYFEQNKTNMQAGLDTGFTQPQLIMANILPSFESQVTGSAEEHPLYAPFRTIHDALSPGALAGLAASTC